MRTRSIPLSLLALSAFGVVSLASSAAMADIGVAWTQVGHPYAASKIAACSPTQIYALNTDHTLWVNNSGGADSGWNYLTTPGGAANIACDGRVLVVMNTDKTLWRAVFNPNGSFNEWIRYSAAAGAASIGGGPGVLTALNTDRGLWTSTALDSATFSGQAWWGRGTAFQAARFTGFQAWSGYNPWHLDNNVARFYALNDNGSLWYNDGVVIDDPGTWRAFSSLPNGAVAAEIAAAGPGELFVLDTTARLWTGTTSALPPTITFNISAGTSFGDTARGSIDMNEDGSWSVQDGVFQFASPTLSDVTFSLDCNAAGFTIGWSDTIGFNAFSGPSSNLTGNGTATWIADDWQRLVYANLANDNASCTLKASDPTSGPPGGQGQCQPINCYANCGVGCGAPESYCSANPLLDAQADHPGCGVYCGNTPLSSPVCAP
jgi:hypothetical protein